MLTLVADVLAVDLDDVRAVYFEGPLEDDRLDPTLDLGGDDWHDSRVVLRSGEQLTVLPPVARALIEILRRAGRALPPPESAVDRRATSLAQS